MKLKTARKGVGHWRQVLPPVIFLAALASGVSAQNMSIEQITPVQFLEDIGASQRIDYSGKLRMLSQRIPAAACYLTAGTNPESAGNVLESAAAEFQQILTALEFGDVSLGIIGEEERRKTLVGLHKLGALWAPMLETARTIRSTGGSPADVAQIAEQSEAVLNIAKLLVSEISGQYSDPTALLQADALTIDLAGRQRMLAQRISKNACLVAMGISTDAARDQLSAAAEMFDNTLHALRDGMENVGVKPPPTDEIAAGLDVVLENWQGLQPIIERASGEGTLDDEHRAIMFTGANQMTGNMNTVVGLYSESSKLGL